MWEKIVLNLVSNAFKFTLAGEIEVRLATAHGRAQLTVRDTGVGIPAEELPRVFERFHRIEHARGRTHEGTGIGLALVRELVRLHGGEVRAESAPGQGSRFVVTLPLGASHLDPARIGADARPLASTATGAAAFVEEALRWLPAGASEPGPSAAKRGGALERASLGTRDAAPDGRPRVVWADDNADMREYVARLLADRFDVEAVADGEAALEAARRQPPDVLLSDVMMPRLDGVELVREVRADPQLADLPVILLSARAGEESRVEGLAAGADDYVIKPFGARELLARVETHAKLSRVRRAAVSALRASSAELAARTEELAILNRSKDQFLAMLGHELRNPLGAIASAVSVLDMTSAPQIRRRGAPPP